MYAPDYDWRKYLDSQIHQMLVVRKEARKRWKMPNHRLEILGDSVANYLLYSIGEESQKAREAAQSG
jgi:hypothetical protein